MKTKALIIILIAGFVAACGVITYQQIQLSRYADRWQQGLMKYYEHWTPAYPVDGLSHDDLIKIVAQIEQLDVDDQNKRILTIEMMDRNHVLIQTGIMKGSLSGVGRTYMFKRVNNTWQMDKSQTGGWVS